VSGTGSVFLADVGDLVRRPLVWVATLAVVASAWSFGTHSPTHDNGYVVYQAALEAAAKAASFFLLGIAAVSIAGVRSRGTVRWILPRPLSRVGFVMGKTGALALAAVWLLVVGAGTSWWVAKDYGFGDVVMAAQEEDLPEDIPWVEEEVIDPGFEAATMRKRTLIATLLVLPALLTATGIGLLVSALLSSASGAVIATLAVAVPLNFLPELLGLGAANARALPFRAASDFLAQVYEFGRHLSTADWPRYGLPGTLGALAAIFGLPAVAAWVFNRLDLTD